MAIYHFSAKIISRANGSSAVASAAYRSASELRDERLGRAHDFSNKAGVIHSEVLLPQGAPERLNDRSILWNEVEAGEKRKDAQLAREVEFSIPREMSERQGVSLARDFVDAQFVRRGMVADLNVHWDKAEDGSPKPHAHVMLAMRDVGPEGFGQKNRDWNSTELLKDWREAWSAHVNERMAELGLEGRIDHRSHAEQGIALEPQHKIGPAAARRPGQGLDAERIEDHARIARENGEKIIANPRHALDAITRQQATFTARDLAVFAFRHSDGKEQFDRVLSAVRDAPELVALGRDGRDQERFTSREMIATEARLERAGDELAGRAEHGVADRHRAGALEGAARRGLVLSAEQRDAFDHVTDGRGLASVIGYAGTGKSAMLGVVREAWERQGYQVRGAALSGIAAENLEGGSGIASRTIASLEHAWGQGRDQLGRNDVLVVDEAGMIGTRQMERVLSQARDAGAKVVLVGDPEQLQAIEAGAAFRSITEAHGAAEITQVRRQREGWQKDATRALATGRTGEAIDAYASQGMVHAAETREAARVALVDGWDRERQAEPDKTRIILTHTNDEVRALNEEARGRLRATTSLGDDVAFSTDRGARRFARGDRVMFLRNERSLGVKNGTLGTIEGVSPERMSVRLDDDRRVAFDAKDYAALDHGYAATVHKAQGVTVDRAHVLATPGMDRHGAYVGLSRHRDGVQLHYGRLTHTNNEVRALNEEARGRLRATTSLGDDVAFSTDRGARQFARGDRVMFLRNERSLGVKNGTLGTIEGVSPDRMSVRLDDDRRVAFDAKDYAALDHGYAATVHKAQGVTVDRAHVLATPGMDRHGAYVGLSRHRDGVQLHYGRDDFADRHQLARTLSRDRAKDMAGDYGRNEAAPSQVDQAHAFAARRGIDGRVPGKPAVLARQQLTRGAVVQRWTAEHGRELADVQAHAKRAGTRATAMAARHEARREAHAREQPLPPRGMLAGLRRPSYEAARGAWEKTARALQRRSRQLASRVERLREYLGPVTGHRRHRGDALARRKVERAHPTLTRLYEAVMAEWRVERARQQEQERARSREQREKERGRAELGRGR